MEKSIIIIGAGLAGLSAGCYGQMNGYRTQIFEMHDLPGGLCTSWKRKGYTFDGCIHWLVGSRPGTEFHRIWEELGTVQGRRFVDYEEFIRIEGASRKTFILYTDPDRLEQHMKELSPQDAGLIKELCNGVRLFTRFDLPIDKPRELYGLLDGLKMAFKMLPFMKAFGKYGKTSIQDFCGGFSDPFLREAFPLSLLFDQPYPVFVLLMILALMHNRNAGYPIGGSLPFARAIERRYLDLGGEIHYNSRVEKILVESCAGQGRGDDRAVGVRLADGAAAPKEHHADAVISAADGRATIFDMLEAKYVSDEIRNRYDEWPVFPPIVQVSLGVARDLSNEPHMVTYLLEIIFGSSHEYWKAMYEERERYEAEKQQIAMAVIGRLEKRFPGITGQVEAVDVATPMTTERYTGNWQGSIMGWATTTETMGREEMSKTLPGLKDFYMIGQWVEGGGLPPAARSGRDAIHIICHQDNRPFVTDLP
jgi:phytoene dehydrogenase-like protein